VRHLDIMVSYFLSVEKMKEKCMECNGRLIRTDSDMVCTNCGLIANQIYEKPSLQLINTEGSYKNQYNSISDRPSSMKSLGTFLGTYRKRNLMDVTGSALSTEKKLQYRRLKSVNDIYLHFSGRQREYRGYSLLTRVCSTLEITDTTKADALYLFKKVHLPLRKEVKLSGLIMGSIYLAIRTRKENIELNRLTKAVQDNGYSMRGKQIIRAASLIRKHAKIRVQYVKSEEYLENIIGRIQKDYCVRNEVMKKIAIKKEYYHCLKVVARQLLKQFPIVKRGGRNPFILAAAMINAADIILARHKMFPQCYLNQRRRGVLTQKKLSEILDIAEFTLREHYLLLAKPLVEAY
jgi:transcription initiation factor TFIIIB Brf1 subunit/transcription initiation factor TFIIB